MFPESEWDVMNPLLGNPTERLDGTASVRSGRLHYEFKQLLPAGVTSIPVDRDIPLRSSIATALGYEHLTIVAGNYAVHRDSSPNGSVDFEIYHGGDHAGFGERVKIRFKHSSPGCGSPFGVCLIIPIGWAASDATLTRAEIDDGFGFATVEMIDGKLMMMPHRPAALPDGTLPFDEDKRLEPEAAAALGYRSVTIKRGVYRMDWTQGEYGRVLLDVDLVPIDVQPAQQIVCYTYQHVTGPCKGCGVSCTDNTNYPMSCAADIFISMGSPCGRHRELLDRRFFSDPVLYKGFFDAPDARAFIRRFDKEGVTACEGARTSQFTMVAPAR
jgi:hypothetical protein